MPQSAQPIAAHTSHRLRFSKKPGLLECLMKYLNTCRHVVFQSRASGSAMVFAETSSCFTRAPVCYTPSPEFIQALERTLPSKARASNYSPRLCLRQPAAYNFHPYTLQYYCRGRQSNGDQLGGVQSKRDGTVCQANQSISPSSTSPRLAALLEITFSRPKLRPLQAMHLWPSKACTRTLTLDSFNCTLRCKH